ncbi:DUF1361 domain-containing protein [Microbacterium flavum]|uniref:DUF1361 domain-containing protein n=1 Tax=Microbacterium flavum TaxID=415216 RepID=UPI0024AE3B58|nr:DUF1361 domain-containing protein [Microbacterium flavum]
MSSVIIAVVCVVLLNINAATLIVLRSRVYGVSLYRPMLLNVVLSFIPVLIAIVGVAGLMLLVPVLASAGSTAPVVLWIYVVLATLAWLLFFPNSVYLITELNLSHREDGETPVPLWYDIVQTLTLTVSGIANAVLSLAIVQTVLIVVFIDPTRPVVPASSWAFAVGAIVLGAVGVYLGRYLRVNSWDVRHPIGLLRKLGAHFRARGKALEAFAFVVTHALLIALIYVPVYALAVAVLFPAA